MRNLLKYFTLCLPLISFAGQGIQTTFYSTNDVANCFVYEVLQPNTRATNECVILDASHFVAKTPPSIERDFCVEFDIFPIGWGKMRGNNNSISGMLASHGSGYYDGWRIALFEWAGLKPVVELGAPNGSWSLRSEIPIQTDLWNRIRLDVCDQSVALWVNGSLAAHGKSPHKLSTPKAPLRIGYSGFGVGSYRFSIHSFSYAQTTLPHRAPGICKEAIAQRRLLNGDFESIDALRELLQATQIPRGKELLRSDVPTEVPRIKLPLLPYDKKLLPPTVLYVSTNGTPHATGAPSDPLNSLVTARNRLRHWRKNGIFPSKGVAVILTPGCYHIKESFKLTAEDSATASAPVVWMGLKGAKLSGGKILTQTNDAQLIRIIKLDEEIPPQKGFGYGKPETPILDLYCNGRPLPLSQWPQDNWAVIQSVTAAKTLSLNATLPTATSHDAPLIEGYFHYQWAHNVLPVQSIEEEHIKLIEEPSFVALTNRPARLQNLWSLVSTNNCWAINKSRNQIKAGHTTLHTPCEYTIPLLQTPIIQAKRVEHHAFVGLEIAYGQSAGIALESCENITIANCRLACLGGTALRAYRAPNISIVDNDFEFLARGAMHIHAKEKSHSVVIINNKANDFGRREHTYTPALLLEADGAIVAHNHFQKAPSSALRIEGSDNLIAANLIERVVLESDDQGGLDMWNNLHYTNNIIYGNIWRNIGSGRGECGQGGVRLDDAISQTIIAANRFEACSFLNFGAIQIHGGTLNHIVGNLISDCAYGISFSPWNFKRWQHHLSTHDHPLSITPSTHNRNSLLRNVLVRTPQNYRHMPAETTAELNINFSQQPTEAVLNYLLPFLPTTNLIGNVSAEPFYSYPK